MAFSAGEDVLIGLGVVGLGGAIVGSWLVVIKDGVARERRHLRMRARSRRALVAVTEASLDEAEEFNVEEIERTIDEILQIATAFWRDVEPLQTTRGDLKQIALWAESLQGVLGAGVRVIRAPSVDVLRVINRVGELEDRLVLRVRLKLRKEGHLRFVSREPLRRTCVGP